MTGPAPVGSLAFARIVAGLSERDRAIVGSVASLRYVTARQVETLHFADHSTSYSTARSCRRVLGRLTERRVLDRLDRRIGGVRAGSAGYIYRLGPIGERLTRNGRRRRGVEPSATFLDHTLAVAQVVADLNAAVHQGRCDLDDVQVEPECWRSVRSGPSGGESLKPDLAVVLGVGEFEHRWFVEVDLDTEHLPTVMRKCHLYDRYYQSGDEQHAHGVFPKVLWSVPDERRAQRIRDALDHQRSLTADLFEVTSAVDLIGALIGAAS
jgi:hypothetical protein